MPDISSLIEPINKHPLYKDVNYGAQVKQLEAEYKNLRFIPCVRDGNCLYRAIAFHVIPLMKEDAFKKKFLSFTEKFQKTGVCSSVYEWYVESIEEMATDEREPISAENQQLLIAYLRLVCSAEAQSDEKYSNFVETDLKSYCTKCIEPMDQRAGDFEIAVLADALEAQIKIIAVTKGKNQVVSYGENTSREIQILHTPDHFEPIFL